MRQEYFSRNTKVLPLNILEISKEIEFETFQQNFTYAEAEEIGQELDKIRR